jgi:tetratricopeptide (TPR) repeat protein
MTLWQKLLPLVVVGELVLLAVLIAARSSARPLPQPTLTRFDPSVAAEIRRLQDNFDASRADEWVRLADEYRTFGLFADADYCFRQGHELGPANGDYLLLWGVTLDRAGRFDEALQRYAEAEKASPQLAPLCRLYRGLIYLRLGKTQQAEQWLRKADELPKAKVMLARYLMRAGRARQAIELLDDLLREFPLEVRVNQLRGWAEEELGNPAAAVPYAERSLRGSKNVQAFPGFTGQEVTAPVDEQRRMAAFVGRLADAQREADAGRFAEAIRLRREQAAGPRRPEADFTVAGWELNLGRAADAIATLQSSRARYGPDLPSINLLGRAYTLAGKHDEARAAWFEALNIKPDADLHRRLADSFSQTGDKSAAQRHAALAAFEDGKAAWLGNNLQVARDHLEKAGQTLSDHLLTWFYLAETRRFLGDREGARAAYQHCLKLNPYHGRSLRGLARLDGQ